MSLLRRLPTVAGIVLAAISALASAQTEPKVVVLRSTSAHGQLSPERVTLALRIAADQLNFSGELPRVVVVVGNKQSADVAEIKQPVPGGPEGAIEVEWKNKHKIYYLWLLSEPTDELLVQGLVKIVADHSSRPGDATPTAVSRVLARLSARVSVAELQKGE